MIRLRSGVVCCQFFVISKHNILCSSHEIHMKYLYITQTMLPDIFRRCGRMLSVPIRLSATTTNYNTLTLGCIIECLQQAKEFHKKPKTYIFKAGTSLLTLQPQKSQSGMTRMPTPQYRRIQRRQRRKSLGRQKVENVERVL